MADATYIHGTDSAEQERLALLNCLTNPSFIDFLPLSGAQSLLELGSGLGLLKEGNLIGLPYIDQSYLFLVGCINAPY